MKKANQTSFNPDLVVEEAQAHYRGDPSVGIWPHTVKIEGNPWPE